MCTSRLEKKETKHMVALDKTYNLLHLSPLSALMKACQRNFSDFDLAFLSRKPSLPRGMGFVIKD